MTDWSREPWIKVYGREGGGWAAMSWEARGLYRLLQTECNRDGNVDHGGKAHKWAAIVFRMPEAVAVAAIDELASEGFLVAANGTSWAMSRHVEQQATSTSGAERVRRHRDKQRNHVTPVTLHPVTGVTNRIEENRKEEIRSEQIARARERVPTDPKAAELAADLQANPTFASLDTAAVAEALIGHLGVAAFNVSADKWRPAIAEAAVMVESGATEARRRQVLGWKFADLRDGRRRSTKRPQGADRVAEDMARIRAAVANQKPETGEPTL